MGFEELVAAMRDWASTRMDIRAIGVCGSYARGTARGDSDVDVVLLTTTPEHYLLHRDWLGDFGQLRSCELEDWGAVQSLRTLYGEGAEVEWGIAAPAWAELHPVDPGTAQIVCDGFLVVFERDALLTNLIAAVSG